MTHRSKLFAFVSLIVLLIFCKIEVNRAAGTDTVYDFTGDKNIINPFPEVITPAEVEEFQRKTVSSRPFPWIEKIYYTEIGQEFSLQTSHEANLTSWTNYYKKSLSRIDSFIFIPRVKKDYVLEVDGEIRNLNILMLRRQRTVRFRLMKIPLLKAIFLLRSISTVNL